MRARQRRRLEPGAVDEQRAVERHRLGAADRQGEAVARDPATQDRRAQHDVRARRRGIGLVGEHQRMAVDDAGHRRQEGGEAGEIGLERPRLRAREPSEILDPVGARFRHDGAERGDLFLGDRDDQLADSAVRHAALRAIFIEPLAPGDAGARLEAALWIIESGMDHFAVARRGMGADPALLLEQQHVAAGQGQGPRHCQSDDAAAHHHAFDRFGH